jgi:ATP-dependent Lhr-like helicase
VPCLDRQPLDCVRDWFREHEWEPFPFQEDVWRAYLEGENVLIHAATGTGKTYAAWLGPVLEWLRDYPPAPRPRRLAAPPLRVLWITPLRALALDTEDALRAPVEDLGLPWTVESRTGDTPARIRARQRERLPTALVTTPESLSLLLTREDAASLFEHLELVVVDEWHELMASKRGVQTELALARLRRPLRDAWQPGHGARQPARRCRGRRTAARPHRPGARAEGARGGRAHPRDDGAVPVVGADRPAHAAGGGAGR